ncbi:MAG: hypothetical protein J6J62_09120, partial [Oscillospiraceae bacterium]|nr:hypothetical protein [Oscillospiraceae bacterium]
VERYRPTQANLAAFSSFCFAGRQPACIRKRKNQSKLSLRRVLRSFSGADISQAEARPAANTLRIGKGLNDGLGNICPVKPAVFDSP